MAGRVLVDEILCRHLVDERDRVAKRVLHLCRIFRVDGCTDVAKCAAKARAELTVVFPTLDVLAMRFQR